MHILMIAPEPFFEPRGTPFSEFHRIRALLSLGHTVDLVTYPFGRDVSMPGLRLFRSARPPLIRGIGIGPSWAKVPLDLALAFTAIGRALSERYDAVHSHEEGAAIGLLLARLSGKPHLYDMHSSLPQQLSNFSFSRSRFLKWLFDRFERVVVRHSEAIIVICPFLGEQVRAIDAGANVVLIENAPGSGDAPVAGSGVTIRGEFGLAAGTPLVVYTGTFEAYQGLDLLYAAARIVVSRRPEARFLLAGGKARQVEQARRAVTALGLADKVLFAGERPAEQVPAILDAADILVSPRSTGTNTPLKIYQYLRSGRAIVATRLVTHTQVLSDEVALLTEPTAEGLAGGMLALIDDPERGRRLAAQAQRLATTKYSDEAYVARTAKAYDHLVAAGGVR